MRRRPFVKRFSLCYRTVVLSVSDVDVLWPNGWTDQDETWHAGRPRPWPRCVRWGPCSPKRGTHTQYLVHVCCGQTAEWIKMPPGTEVGLGPDDIVLDGDTALPKRAQLPPQFLSHVCCGQTACWIKMPLGMEIVLGPGHTVLDWNPAPPTKGVQQPSLFGRCLLWPNGHPSQQLLSSCFKLVQAMIRVLLNYTTICNT